MLNMGVRMVSSSEIQAEGLLSDLCSDSGREENKNALQKKKNLPSLVFGVVLNLTISEYCFSGRRIFSRFKELQQTTHTTTTTTPHPNLKSMSK